MAADSFELVAQAEKILSSTLAYQAAIAVHELKDRLDIDVAELRLVVMPQVVSEPGCYRVVCTIVSLAMPKALTVEVLVQHEGGTTPIGKRTKGAGRRQPAKPKQSTRRRRRSPR
jgi:hypothetical protein